MTVDLATIGLEFRTEGLVKGRTELDRTTAAAGRTADAVDKSGKSAESADRGFSSWANTLKGLALGAVITQSIRTADALNQVNSRLSLVTKSTAELTQVQRQLFQLSQQNRSDFAATADLYTALARSTKDLGVTQEQLLRITGTFGKALIVSGGSAQSAQAAITQFNQAMASGVLRGEEFNSISEQAPRIMDLLASSLGKTRGELRQLAQDGKLTSDVVLPAILKGAKDVEAEFARMPVTVAQAGQVLQNSLGQAVLAIDNATGSTSSLAGAVVDLATILDSVTASMGGVNRETQKAGILQNGLAVVFETVAVLAANTAFVLKGIGNELGAIGAQVGAVLRGDFAQAAEIGRLAKLDAEAARAQIDATTRNILNARQRAQDLKDVAGITDAQSRRMAVLNDTIKAGTKATSDNTKAKKAKREESVKLADAIRDEERAMFALLEGEEKYRRLQDSRIEAADEMLRSIEFETQLLTLNTQERAVATAQRELERKGIVAGTEAYDEYIQKIRQAVINREATQESVDRIKEINDEGKRFAADLERGLTDSLFRAFEAGRGFFSTLWDGIKNLFKTTVLKLVIQGVVGSVLGSVGLGKALADDGTGSGTGAGGIIQAASTLKKVYESFTNGSAASIIGAFGAGGFGGSAAGYSEIAFQFSSALADAGFYETAGLIADNAAILSQGAAVVGAALTAYSIVAAFDAGEYGKAIGTAIGYYFFGDLGGAIGGYLGGVVDSFFGGGGDNRGGDTHGGGVYSSNGGFLTNDAQVGAIFNLRGEAIKDLTDRADAQVSVLVGSLAVSLQNAAENVDRILGTKALQEITLGLAIDLKGYGKDVLGYFNLVGADGERVNYANRDLSGNPEEAFKELSDAAAQAILDGLRGAEIPTYARDIFSAIEKEAEDAKETLAGTEFLQEFIAKLREAEQFSKTLQGLPIDSLNSISIEAAQSLAKLSGGIETLTSNLEGYLTNFYTEAELQVSALQNVQNAFTQLNAAGAFAQTAEEFQRLLIDPTRANFRALVEAQDVNTEAGQRTYAALLALSGAVASVVPAAASAADAIASLFGAVNDNAGIRAATEAEATTAADRRDVIAGRRAIEEANALQAQEAATAAAEAATNAASARTDAEQALRQAYEAEIRALDAIIAARESAVQALEQAYQRESGVLRQAADGFGELAQSLRAFVSDLNGIADTPEQSTARLRARFNATIAAALGGDADAARNIPGAGRDYIDAASLTAETRVDMLREIARVQVATEGVIDFAEAQKTVAEQQLDALNQQVAGLLTVDQSVLSVAEAIAALQTATVAAIDAEAQKAILTAQVSSLITVNESVLSVRDAIMALENTQKQIAGIATGGVGRTKGGVGYTEFINRAGDEPGSEVLGTATQLGRLERIAAQNPGRADLADQVANLLRTANESLAAYPDLVQAFDSIRQLQRNATAQSILAANPVAEYDPALRSYYGSQYGINLGPIGSVPGFASGGIHDGGWRMVGEAGPELEYTPPSRIFSNGQTNALMDNSGMEQRLERLENALMVGMATIAKNTADTSRYLQRWDGDGLPEERDVTA